MNKSTKIWLNYITGGIISVLLLWAIYRQVLKQVHDLSTDMWQHTGPIGFLVACIVLMIANALLESYKWKTLLCRAEPVSLGTAFGSWLAGVAFSIITPNRIGEYPGRILYLGGSNTFRYINVSVSGITSQLAGIYFWGFIGLIYYNIAFPDTLAQVALGICVLINFFISVVYWRFDNWVPAMTQNKWLRRFAVYGRLMGRVSAADKMKVLTISLLRVMVFTAQYLFLLRWMNVDVPLLQGFCLAALFFWVMAVIPSLALTELGIRGAVSLYIFAHFSSNTIGILAATTGLWLLNLVIPSVAGSVLITKMKWLR